MPGSHILNHKILTTIDPLAIFQNIFDVLRWDEYRPAAIGNHIVILVELLPCEVMELHRLYSGMKLTFKYEALGGTLKGCRQGVFMPMRI